MFNENGLEYEDIKKLMSVKAKKEYVSVIHGRIEQEEAIEYKVEYCEVNYEYKHNKKLIASHQDHFRLIVSILYLK